MEPDAQCHGTEPSEHEIQRINTLLRSNYGCYTPDPENISQCLSKTERELRRITDEIPGLASSIAEQEQLEWIALRYKSLLAPIRKLPCEVVALVFEFTCSEPTTFGDVICCPPLLLSSICAGWRDLARRIPSLWSSLFVGAAVYSFCVPLLALHLELSQQHPLYLTISMPDIVEFSPEDDPAQDMLFMLLAQSHRWREVTLDIREMMDALDIVEGKLPLLQVLNMVDRDDEVQLGTFEVAPSLRKVVVMCGVEGLGLPWTQITHFTFQTVLFDTVLHGLSLASEVREVAIYQCPYSSGSGDTYTRPLMLRHLCSLSIVVDQKDPHFHHYFQWLTLPQLVSFSIAGDSRSPPTACTSLFEDDCFPSFLERSACTITSLSLTNFPLSDDEAIELLSALPALTSLTIHEKIGPKYPYTNSILTAKFLQSLTLHYDPDTVFSNDPGPSPSLLHLKHLHSLDLRLHGTLPTKVIADVVVSRWTRSGSESTSSSSESITASASAAVNSFSSVERLAEVRILALLSKDDMVLDVQELGNLLGDYRRLGLRLFCESRLL
ncbi:hypothetical protein D9758_003504 [Tetrapyrgos nigripes]|uniref:F-box domain-containing protein n=1 Tax=Tetrapyrgos nigripes TaxID=182062 RepID=A0A8H5GVJ1_9AGAR|nr:hypothetical protein D9758_003504 [Tetrapyrgos nigripes]